MNGNSHVFFQSNTDLTTENKMSEISNANEKRLERGLITLNEIFRKRDDFIQARYKISSLELELIQFVVNRGPQKMKAVAEFFSIKLSTLTSIIDKAESRKILKRVNSKDDRRVVFLDATKKGKRIYAEYGKYLKEIVERMQGSFEEDSFVRFIEGMETFNQISPN